jgi:glycosyltransferase involved in cell wall biosynthesis
MRILVHPHASEIGGSQLNAVDLAAAVRDLGHEVLMTCEDGPLVDRVLARGLEHLRLPPGGRRPSPASSARLDRLVVERGVDVVHTHEWPPVFDALWSRARRGTAVVGTVMSMSVVPFYPRSVPLLVGTEQIREAAIEAGHRRVVLLEPPVDTDVDHPGVVAGGFRAEHGLAADVPLVAMVCRLVPELKLEGLLAACDAVGELAASGRAVQLVIAGDGRSRPEVEERAQRANAAAGSRVVVLTGQLEDPRPAYAAADIMVGQGGSALRGMAFGKPLVVVGEEGFSDLLTPLTAPRFLRKGWFGLGPGSLGEGVPALREALDRLLRQQELGPELGRFARDLVVERFGLERAARLLVEEYARAVTTPVPVAEQAVDVARSTGGMLAHKARRRVQRWRGTARTDDANAAPVRSVDGARS